MKVKTLLDGTPINQSQFKKWIKALRSGEYKQCTGGLQNNNGYCCLGAAVKVIVPSHLQIINDGEDTTLKGGYLTFQENAPLWLKLINTDMGDRTNEALTSLNDNLKLSFDEIADCLEAVYVLGVLND